MMGINLLRYMDANFLELLRKLRKETPEERELNKKFSELQALEAELAQCELDLATLQAELRAFEGSYLRVVGVRYAELDEIEAQVAEIIAQRNPKDSAAQEQATKARFQAQESAEAMGDVQEQEEVSKFKPSEALRKLYRDVAKRIHPDLATDDEEHARRQELMAEANHAYREGNEEGLRAILEKWESSPESVEGEGIGAELVRLIRQIARAEERLRNIETEIAQIEGSELYTLKTRVEATENGGTNLISEMIAQIDGQITDARKHLAEVRQ